MPRIILDIDTDRIERVLIMAARSYLNKPELQVSDLSKAAEQMRIMQSGFATYRGPSRVDCDAWLAVYDAFEPGTAAVGPDGLKPHERERFKRARSEAFERAAEACDPHQGAFGCGNRSCRICF